MHDEVESTVTVGGDGPVLDVRLSLPASPCAALVACHPHPLHGGSMDTPVPTTLVRAAAAAGAATARFDFRGVRRSTGTHDHGRGERDDLRAVAAALRSHVGLDVPLILAGWSFGADVALAVGAGDTTGPIAAWLAVAAPLAIVDPAEMVAGASDAPTVLLVPEHDQFRSPAAAAEVVAGWRATTLEVVPGADHFLAARLDHVAAACTALIGGLT